MVGEAERCVSMYYMRQSSAEVSDEWSHNSTPPYALMVWILLPHSVPECLTPRYSVLGLDVCHTEASLTNHMRLDNGPSFCAF